MSVGKDNRLWIEVEKAIEFATTLRDEHNIDIECIDFDGIHCVMSLGLLATHFIVCFLNLMLYLIFFDCGYISFFNM